MFYLIFYPIPGHWTSINLSREMFGATCKHIPLAESLGYIYVHFVKCQIFLEHIVKNPIELPVVLPDL